MNQCRTCVHPIAVAYDDRGQYWVHQATGLTRCPAQPARRRQVAEPATRTVARSQFALAGA